MVKNILVITKLTITTLFVWVLMVRLLMPTRASLLTQQAEKFIEALHITQMAYIYHTSAKPVYCSSIIAMIVPRE
jgi:hypothetical protein